MSSGSQKRRKNKGVKVNCTPAEFAALDKLAQAHRCSLSALALNALLDVPLPRTRQPRLTDELMRRFFVELARTRDAMKLIEAELGKSGSNVNQIAHVLNAGRPPERVMNLIESTLLDHQAVVAKLDEFVRDLLELRTGGMISIGQEPPRGGDTEQPRSPVH